jgi:hypothetical protein
LRFRGRSRPCEVGDRRCDTWSNLHFDQQVEMGQMVAIREGKADACPKAPQSVQKCHIGRA